MYREFETMHNLYTDWVTATLSWVGRRFGDEVLQEAMKKGMEPWTKDLVDIYPKNDLRRSVQMLAHGLQGHLKPLTIEEDEEKIVLTQSPCGSGGQLIRRGAYGSPNFGFASNYVRVINIEHTV